MFLSLVRIFQNHNSRYWIIILYFATSTGTSLKASPRVSSLDHCLYNCSQIAHSNLKCTTNFYSALAILPPLDPDRVFFSDHWLSPWQEKEWNRFKNAKIIREARLANTLTKSCDSLYWPTLPRCSWKRWITFDRFQAEENPYHRNT